MNVYFMQAGEDGPIKIGIAKDVQSRYRGLQTGNHRKLKILFSFEFDGDIQKKEKEIHEWFRFQHIRGEWFRPDKYLLDCITRMKNGEDFSDDWIEWNNDIQLIDHELRMIAKKYRDEGNYYAVKFIAKDLYELHKDLMENKF